MGLLTEEGLQLLRDTIGADSRVKGKLLEFRAARIREALLQGFQPGGTVTLAPTITEPQTQLVIVTRLVLLRCCLLIAQRMYIFSSSRLPIMAEDVEFILKTMPILTLDTHLEPTRVQLVRQEVHEYQQLVHVLQQCQGEHGLQVRLFSSSRNPQVHRIQQSIVWQYAQPVGHYLHLLLYKPYPSLQEVQAGVPQINPQVEQYPPKMENDAHCDKFHTYPYPHTLDRDCPAAGLQLPSTRAYPCRHIPHRYCLRAQSNPQSPQYTSQYPQQAPPLSMNPRAQVPQFYGVHSRQLAPHGRQVVPARQLPGRQPRHRLMLVLLQLPQLEAHSVHRPDTRANPPWHYRQLLLLQDRQFRVQGMHLPSGEVQKPQRHSWQALEDYQHLRQLLSEHALQSPSSPSAQPGPHCRHSVAFSHLLHPLEHGRHTLASVSSPCRCSPSPQAVQLSPIRVYSQARQPGGHSTRCRTETIWMASRPEWGQGRGTQAWLSKWWPALQLWQLLHWQTPPTREYSGLQVISTQLSLRGVGLQLMLHYWQYYQDQLPLPYGTLLAHREQWPIQQVQHTPWCRYWPPGHAPQQVPSCNYSPYSHCRHWSWGHCRHPGWH